MSWLDKWRSFTGCRRLTDNHSSIIQAIDKAKISQPSVIIAHTVPGRGVDFGI